jgi:hypothetical protein
MNFIVLFGGSLAFVNPAPYRYVYPVCATLGSHLSSLIQVAEFNERPLIVPPEVLESLNVRARALSPKK